MFEIFDQQELFKLDMIVEWFESQSSVLLALIYDQQGNPNLIPLVVIPYLIILIWNLDQPRDKARIRLPLMIEDLEARFGNLVLNWVTLQSNLIKAWLNGSGAILPQELLET